MTNFICSTRRPMSSDSYDGALDELPPHDTLDDARSAASDVAPRMPDGTTVQISEPDGLVHWRGDVTNGQLAETYARQPEAR